MRDQAEELRKIVRNISTARHRDKKSRSIAVVSAKNGEGKTTFSIFLSKAAALQNKKILIIDETKIFPEILEISPKKTLAQYLKNECPLEDIVHNFRKNADFVVCGGENLPKNLNFGKLISDLSEFSKKYDYIITDCRVKTNEKASELANLADEIILIAASHANSLDAAFSTLRTYENKNVSLLVNFADETEALTVKNRLFTPQEKFMNFVPNFLGFLPKTNDLTPFLHENISVLQKNEIADFSLKINEIAKIIDGEKISASQNFFAKLAGRTGGNL